MTGTDELVALLSKGSAGAVVEAMTGGVWRRSTDSTVYGREALAVKAYGASLAYAGGLSDWYTAVHAAALDFGDDAVVVAACEVALKNAQDALDRVGRDDGVLTQWQEKLTGIKAAREERAAERMER